MRNISVDPAIATNNSTDQSRFIFEKSVARLDYTFLKQEGLAVASIARDDPSTLPGDDPFPRARMRRDRNAR